MTENRKNDTTQTLYELYSYFGSKRVIEGYLCSENKALAFGVNIRECAEINANTQDTECLAAYGHFNFWNEDGQTQCYCCTNFRHGS